MHRLPSAPVYPHFNIGCALTCHPQDVSSSTLRLRSLKPTLRPDHPPFRGPRCGWSRRRTGPAAGRASWRPRGMYTYTYTYTYMYMYMHIYIYIYIYEGRRLCFFVLSWFSRMLVMLMFVVRKFRLRVFGFVVGV